MNHDTPLPLEIDAQQIIRDLNEWGWLDYKIEIACGFSGNYVKQVRGGGIQKLSYQRAARLYNFWLDEAKVAQARADVAVVVVATT